MPKYLQKNIVHLRRKPSEKITFDISQIHRRIFMDTDARSNEAQRGIFVHAGASDQLDEEETGVQPIDPMRPTCRPCRSKSSMAMSKMGPGLLYVSTNSNRCCSFCD